MQNSNQTFEVTPEMLASNGKRIANYLIDLIVQYIIVFVVAFVVILVASVFELTGLIEAIAGMNSLQELFFGLMIMIMYYGLMETIGQRTVGKLITGTMVVMEDGGKPDSRTILLRTLCRLIPFEAFSFLGQSGRFWHDTIMNTCVVDKKIYEEAFRFKDSFDEIGTEQV